MKKYVILLFSVSTLLFSEGYYLKGDSKKAEQNSVTKVAKKTGFLHPSDFKGTDEEKEQVIVFIQELTKKQMALIGMDSPSLARQMEQQQLSSFKSLIQAEDRNTLDACISNLKIIDSLDYTMLKAMYDNEVQAKNQKLSW